MATPTKSAGKSGATKRSSSRKSTNARVEGRTAAPAPDPAPAATIEQSNDQASGKRRLPDYASDWPRRGGLGDDAPQPWDLAAQGITVSPQRAGIDPTEAPTTTIITGKGDQIELAPGAPDPVSPIVPAHGRPMLSSGSIDVGPGPAVEGAVTELGQLLGLLGYANSVTRGENPLGVVDDSLMAAVERFREDFDVREDPKQFQRNGRANAESHVGPWTWEGLLRAAEQVEADAELDRRQLTHRRR